MTMDEQLDGPQSESTPYDLEGFRAQLGTTFHVEAGSELVAVQLAEVAEGRTGGGFLRFSVLFHGPAARLLPQGTYVFRHDIMGSLPLFIVPVFGSNAERIIYEACFSQRIPTTVAP